MAKLAETQGFPHISQGHFLGSGHDDGFRIFDGLDYGQRFISSARRTVDDQVVQGVPFGIAHELPDGTHFQGSPPDQGVVLGQETLGGQKFQMVAVTEGDQLFSFHLDMLVHIAQHTGHAGAVEVHIHQAYLIAPFTEEQGQIHGNRALAYTAFATHDDDLMFDMLQEIGNGRILRILLRIGFAAGAVGMIAVITFAH